MKAQLWIEIARGLGGLDDPVHRPSDDHQLAPRRVGGLRHGTQPGDIGRKGGDGYAGGRLLDELY